jgi:antitoxin component HigA of HigAB toxin-antitoxin module
MEIRNDLELDQAIKKVDEILQRKGNQESSKEELEELNQLADAIYEYEKREDILKRAARRDD